MNDSTDETEVPRNPLRFEGMNWDLPIATKGVQIRFQTGRNEQWIEMLLAIDESTTRKDLTDAWHVIKEWQRRLTEYQGRWTGGGDGGLYAYLDHLAQSGKSYNDIAKWLNKRIGDNVAKLSGLLESVSGLTNGELWAVPATDRALAYHEAYGLQERTVGILEAMGYSDENARAWLAKAIDRYRAGESVTSADDPITGKDHAVYYRVQQWRKNKGKG